MTELIFYPISEWDVTECKSEIDDRLFVVKMLGNKGRLFIMTGTEIMMDMAHGQFVMEFARIKE